MKPSYKELHFMLQRLVYMECTNCKNYFFTVDIDGYNEPVFCPYCGTDFEYELEI